MLRIPKTLPTMIFLPRSQIPDPLTRICTCLLLQKFLPEVCVPDMETGCCLGSERNGVGMSGGGEGGPGPPERGKDNQSMPSKGGDNMEKDEEEQPNQV
jgi:hypothetical protein